MITHKENTFSGYWPMTRENTWYGYKASENFYQWWKNKKTALKNRPTEYSSLYRATLIDDKMYINLQYLFSKPF